MAPRIIAGLALDRHGLLRENRGCVEEGAVMLATVKTVAKADSVRTSESRNSDVAAQATAGVFCHRFAF